MAAPKDGFEVAAMVLTLEYVKDDYEADAMGSTLAGGSVSPEDCRME